MSIGVRIKNNMKNIGYFKTFVIIESILTVIFLTLCVVWNGQPLYQLMLSYLNRYTDYFLHLGVASAPFGTNIYEYTEMACFPPLAYLMYAFLARIGGYQAEDPALEREHPYYGHNMTIFLLYNIVCIVIMLYGISLFLKKRGFVNQVLFPLLVIFSYPVAFTAMQRGNSVLLAAPLLMIALAWRDDPSKIKRELALVLIAVCAGLKIYPAVFGLLYLKEKRWGEALRLVLYGIVLFFAPFAFFGGIEGFKTFLKTIISLYGTINDGSISGFVASVVHNWFGSKTQLFCTLVQQGYLVFSLIAFFIVKNKRFEVLILCCLMAIYVSSGWMYTCIYLLPAMMVFFQEHEGKSVIFRKGNIPDYLAFILFLCVFSRPFALGEYRFIYGTISMIASLFNLVIIGTAIYHKWIKSILEM